MPESYGKEFAKHTKKTENKKLGNKKTNRYNRCPKTLKD